MPREQQRPERKELLPNVDPELLRAALNPVEPEPELVFNPDDEENAEYLFGNDPESEISRISDRRSLIRKQALSSGGQLVFGILVAMVGLGLAIMAITNPELVYIIPAAIVSPLSAWFVYTRWKRWLGQLPYFYKLLTSLGEDAENVLEDRERKQHEKYVRKIGDLYAHNKKQRAKEKDS
ncbi:MAG: hypothetical protein KC996_03610 [Phycisphaerales bacterium]|nr:hypothetical protein [Phycisphaerales bacterium]